MDARFVRWQSTLLIAALTAAGAAHADPLHALQVLREGGCGGTRPAARALEHDGRLDSIARLWSGGRTLSSAAERGAYAGTVMSGLHVNGPDASMVDLLKRSGCSSIDERRVRDVGLFRHGADTWIVLGAPSKTPSPHETTLLASRVLALVNDARARGARCGGRSYSPAPPIRLSTTLVGVALGHAADMAEHDYFEHQDLAGHTPADRVRAVGYRERLVGENIAYGPQTADEVVQGWLDSPGHCENIMDPRFEEMGLAYAPGRASRRGLYWVQVLAAPRV